MDAMQKKIDEERKALEEKKGMEEEEKNKVKVELERRESELRKAKWGQKPNEIEPSLFLMYFY